MKKIVLTTTITFAILTTIAQTKLSIKLHPIQVIELPALLDSINLENMSSDMLKIYSTSRYIVKKIVSVPSPVPSNTFTHPNFFRSSRPSATTQGLSSTSVQSHALLWQSSPQTYKKSRQFASQVIYSIEAF